MLGPFLGQSSIAKSHCSESTVYSLSSKHTKKSSHYWEAFAPCPPQACSVFSPRLRPPKHCVRKTASSQVAYSRDRTPEYSADPLQLAQSLAAKSRECLQYQGSPWQQDQRSSSNSNQWSHGSNAVCSSSQRQSVTLLASGQLQSSTAAASHDTDLHSLQWQERYQSHHPQPLPQQRRHRYTASKWLQKLWPTAKLSSSLDGNVNSDVAHSSSSGRGHVTPSQSAMVPLATDEASSSADAGHPSAAFNDHASNNLQVPSVQRDYSAEVITHHGDSSIQRGSSSSRQNAWGLDTSRFATGSSTTSSSSSHSYSYSTLDTYSSVESMDADLTNHQLAAVGDYSDHVEQQQQQQMLDAAWLSAMGALSATATTTELAAAASVAPPSAQDSMGQTQASSSTDESHKSRSRSSALSSSSSRAGTREDDWLTAVLSDSTSRLNTHSNVVLTNSLKRLASLRTLGGNAVAAGAAAAAAVDVDGSEGLVGLLENVRSRFGSFQLQHFEEVALQLAQLGCQPDDDWLAAFERSSAQVMPGGSPRLLSRLLLARAKLSGSCSSEWCSQCLRHMAAQPERLTVSSWINALRALVRLGQAPDRSFQTVFFRSSAERLDDVSPELLTTLVWSLARLQLPPTHLWWRSLVQATAAIEKSFTHSQLASLVHSMSLWAEPGGIAARDVQVLVDILLAEVDVQLSLMQPAELTTILWSLGDLKASGKYVVDWQLQANLLGAVQSQLPRLTPSQLSSLCWGLAKLHHDLDEGFAEALLLELQAQIQGFTDSGLANVMWALAKLQLQPGAAFRQSLWQEWHARCGNLAIGDLCTLFWALARLQLQLPTDLMQELLDQSQSQLCSCDAGQLANLTWALGRLQANPSSAWLFEFEQASLRILPAALLPDLVNLARGRNELAQQRVSDGGYAGNPQPASVAWQAAVLRELRTRCRCLGHDMDCLQLVQVLKEMGIEGLSEGAAAAEASFWADAVVNEECYVVFQPGCR